MKRNYLYIAPLYLLFLFTSCEKLQYDDPLHYTTEEALATVTDYYYQLARSSFQSVVFYSNDGYYFGAGLDMLSDQYTNTNRVQQWWDFAYEPRKTLNNSQSYGGVYNFSIPYQVFYQANLDATKVLDGLHAGNKGIDGDGNDRTDEIYAFAHLVQGIAQGYLGAIYDRGIIVDTEEGDSEHSFNNSYKELIENGVAHLDSAIAHANAASSITGADFYTGVNLTKATFIQFANSLAARLLAAIPRSKDEAAALGSTFWGRVYTYASNGITENLLAEPYAGSGSFYNYGIYYSLLTASSAPYLQADIKIPYFADTTGAYPYDYPTDESVVLDPVATNDNRFATYFKYYSGFGYLRTDRGRNLFSNYGHYRWGTSASNFAYSQNQPLFLAEEVRLLRAEAKFWQGDYTSAAAELNSASADRKANGGLGDVPASEAALRYVLHYEYSIGIAVAGSAINPFAFMRRNNLLQAGTATEYPIPEQQILLTDQSVYTFGGTDNEGQTGKWGEITTAGSDWGWKGSKVAY
ncbi:MAG: hypothetical protein QM610_12465 [Chitinophagaceae bacterium]